MSNTTWYRLLWKELREHGETMEDIVSTTLTGSQMHAEFDDGYGGTEGVRFTAWTKSRVYFPACYDGAEWVDSVARNPDGQPTEHIGGG